MFIKRSSSWVEWQMMGKWWWVSRTGVSLSVCHGWNLEPVWKKPRMHVQAAATIKTYSSMGQWDNCVCTCTCDCVCVHAGTHACRPVRALTRGVRDMSVCLCMYSRLCGWAHSDMSQATSRPHKSMSLGGGILMWKWEQWFLLLMWTRSRAHWIADQKWWINY